MSRNLKARSRSANRQSRSQKRRHSLTKDFERSIEQHAVNTNTQSATLPSTTGVFLHGIDFRETKDKIASLERQLENNLTHEEQLDVLIHLQLYTRLEYGEKSIENANCYIKLGQLYYDNLKLLPQAKSHILNARQILENLHIKPSDEHLKENLFGYDVYTLLAKYSYDAKKYSMQLNTKTKNKHILSIDMTHIEHDLDLIEKYLDKLYNLMGKDDYNDKYLQYILIGFDVKMLDVTKFNSKIENIFQDLKKTLSSKSQFYELIDVNIRYGFYLINFFEKAQEGLNCFKEAGELCENQEKNKPSERLQHQLANVYFQWGKALLKLDHLTSGTETKFKNSINLYKELNPEDKATIIPINDELATYYMKIENYEEAVQILCNSLDDKKELYGEFSKEVIQTESRIGAIFLRECDYINAAKYLIACLQIQEFVYGTNDARTRKTRDTIEILKKDQNVLRLYFSKTKDGLLQNRPNFQVPMKFSHTKDDHQLLFTATQMSPLRSKP